MSNFNVDNMAGFLGSDCADADADAFGTYLEDNGWILDIPCGEESYRAFRQGEGGWREMDENEWQDALQTVFG